MADLERHWLDGSVAKPTPGIAATATVMLRWRMRLAATKPFLPISWYLPLPWADTPAPLQLFGLPGWPHPAAVAVWPVGCGFSCRLHQRAIRRFTPVFRLLHRMHHSAERIDAFGAFWFGPPQKAGSGWCPRWRRAFPPRDCGAVRQNRP